MPSSCSWCKSQDATLVCGRCKSAYYCNVKCQRKQWKQHKKRCNKSFQNKSKNNLQDSTKNELCKYFGSARGCNKTNCCYSHSNPNSIPFCRHYFNIKGCKFNNKCKFRHKYHVVPGLNTKECNQETVLDSDRTLDSFQEVITLFSMQSVRDENNVNFDDDEQEHKIDALLNNKIDEIRKKIDKKEENEQHSNKTMPDDILERIIRLRDFYRYNILLKIKNEFDRIMEKGGLNAEAVAFYYGLFNSIILLSQLSESIKFYEKKFQEKQICDLTEFGAMYCQYYYCKDQKKQLLSGLLRGEIVISSMNAFLMHYFENHDDAGYSGLIPEALCDELASHSVKPWDEDAMAVIGALYIN